MSPAYDKRQLLKSAYNYAQGGQWEKALEEYRRISKLFPDDPNVYSMIADILVKRSDPMGAMANHLEAAKIFKVLGNDDKELGALRKALRVQAGNSAAAARMEDFFQRALAKTGEWLATGKLKEAEDLAGKLLDAEPGNLAANRMLDEIRAKKLQAEAVQAFEEEERLAVAQAPAVDATKEVLQRLGDTAEKYLAAEDYDNAVETLLIMLKIDPGRHEIRAQLDRAQDQLKKKQDAQVVWQTLLAKDSQRMDDVKEQEFSAQEKEQWELQEKAVRERLQMELDAAEEAAQAELAIIAKAVHEIKNHVPKPGAGEADQSRLRALAEEKANLEESLKAEREGAFEREKQIQADLRRESELLRHAIEMERMEAEAKAKVEALKEIEAKLEAERKEQQEMLARERQRSASAEEALRKQMQELMREEMAKLRDEMQGKALEDVKQKLEAEQRQREQTEKEIKEREAASVARYQGEQRQAEEERAKAVENVSKERQAIQALKGAEEARRAAAVEEALKRRSLRTDGSDVEGKQAVFKASRRISDALHAAATKHLEADVDGMLETARRYLQQDLLLDAMRICQKITVLDPTNEKVKDLLKEIYVKKGL